MAKAMGIEEPRGRHAMRVEHRAVLWTMMVLVAGDVVAQPLPDSQHVVDVSSTVAGSFRDWRNMPMSVAYD